MKKKTRLIDKFFKTKKKKDCCSVEIIEVKEENSPSTSDKKDSCCHKEK